VFGQKKRLWTAVARLAARIGGAPKNDHAFQNSLPSVCSRFAGRHALVFRRATNKKNSAPGKNLFKREDLIHPGRAQINNALARSCSRKEWERKKKVSSRETGAGSRAHGVAPRDSGLRASVASASFTWARWKGTPALNVARNEISGADVVTVNAGDRQPQEAIAKDARLGHEAARQSL